MKRIAFIISTLAILFTFAACGGTTKSTDAANKSTDSIKTTPINNDSIVTSSAIDSSEYVNKDYK